MAISVTLDLEHRVVVSTLAGEVTLRDIVEGMRAIVEMPGYEASFNRLSDCRTVTRLPSYEEARTIANLVRASVNIANPVRRAYLVMPGAPYGVVRIIQTLASPDAELIQIFTDEAEARAYVGLPPATTQPNSA